MPNTNRRLLAALAALVTLPSLARADELSDAFDALKVAMAANNAAEVKRLALETSRLARAEFDTPKPTDAAQAEYWDQRMLYVHQMDVFTEYALGATAIAPNLPPADVILLVDSLIDQNAKSAYLEMTVSTYLTAVKNTAGADAQLAAAEMMLGLLPQSEDALFALAEGHFTASRQKEAGEHATRLVTTLEPKPKPEAGTEADWQRKKETLLGRGYYIAGVSACQAEVWADCDRNLRAAEPLVKAQTAVHAPLYFYLGLSNYRLAQPSKNRARLQEALGYGKQAAAIAGPLQDPAKQNVSVMERELPGYK